MIEQTLQRRTIVVTRTSDQAGDFSRLLEERGATVIEIPTIKIVPRESEELDRAILQLDDYDWLFFTSVNGVRFFFDRFQELRSDKNVPAICTIGPATAGKVEEYGFEVKLQPKVFQAEGLLEEFSTLQDGDLSGLNILLPRAAVAREILPEQLERLGAKVDLIPVYDTVAAEESADKLQRVLATRAFDLITFTSSSTVRFFVELAGNTGLHGLPCGAIGPITADTAQEHGLEVIVTPESSTIPDFVNAIELFLATDCTEV